MLSSLLDVWRKKSMHTNAKKKNPDKIICDVLDRLTSSDISDFVIAAAQPSILYYIRWQTEKHGHFTELFHYTVTVGGCLGWCVHWPHRATLWRHYSLQPRFCGFISTAWDWPGWRNVLGKWTVGQKYPRKLCYSILKPGDAKHLNMFLPPCLSFLRWRSPETRPLPQQPDCLLTVIHLGRDSHDPESVATWRCLKDYAWLNPVSTQGQYEYSCQLQLEAKRKWDWTFQLQPLIHLILPLWESSVGRQMYCL